MTEKNVENITSESDKEKEMNRLGWAFLIALTIILLVFDCAHWDSTFTFYHDYHSYFVGFIIGFVYSIRIQKIIDYQKFLLHISIGLIIISISLIRQLLTVFNSAALFAAALPFAYVLFLRILLFCFYPDYPSIEKFPTIIFYTRSGQFWKDKELGYVPNVKDKTISILMNLYFYAYFFIALFYACN